MLVITFENYHYKVDKRKEYFKDHVSLFFEQIELIILIIFFDDLPLVFSIILRIDAFGAITYLTTDIVYLVHEDLV